MDEKHIKPTKNNSFEIELKGENIICQTFINLIPYKLSVVGYYRSEDEWDENEDSLNHVSVHLRSGITISFAEWYYCDSEFVGEAIHGFSGQVGIKLLIVFINDVLLDV